MMLRIFLLNPLTALLLALGMFFIICSNVHALELSGNVTAEYRYFFESPVRDNLEKHNLSVAFEPKLYHLFANSRDSISFIPFVRLDQNDPQRTHLDIRELKWQKVGGQWELRIGIDKVFWGVTETVHLVNIINQVDMVENPDEEDLLGQPMINLTLIQNWGNLNLFVLPAFRERTFPGRDGRPGSSVLISNDKAIYESDAKQWHTDFAVRWSKTIGPWDIGISDFYGTSREPRFDSSVFTLDSRGERELIPIYEITNQIGMDIQCTIGGWLLKLEAIHRSGQADNFFASATGFEYTFENIASSGTDFGVFGEYLYDEREFKTMNRDIAAGVRLSFNDMQSTEVLAALIQDTKYSSRSYYLEASRRLGNSFKLAAEIRGVANVDDRDPLVEFKADQYVQISLGYYF